MKIAVIHTHPNPDSFTYSLREAVVSQLQELGHQVQDRDLYTLQFDPVLSLEEFADSKSGQYREDVRAEQAYIQWADYLIFIYPLWWGTMPALLKGYIDRVFAYGFAYEVADGEVKQLLTAKKVILITTMGNSDRHYRAIQMYDAMKKTVDAGIFEFAGMNVLEHKYYASVTSVNETTRKEMLEDVKSTVVKWFTSSK